MIASDDQWNAEVLVDAHPSFAGGSKSGARRRGLRLDRCRWIATVSGTVENISARPTQRTSRNSYQPRHSPSVGAGPDGLLQPATHTTLYDSRLNRIEVPTRVVIVRVMGAVAVGKVIDTQHRRPGRFGFMKSRAPATADN